MYTLKDHSECIRKKKESLNHNPFQEMCFDLSNWFYENLYLCYKLEMLPRYMLAVTLLW